MCCGYGENKAAPDAVTSIKVGESNIIENEYDSLNRLSTRTLKTTTPVETAYSYLQGADNTKTTTLVSSMQTGDETLSYTYDENGNITSISKNGEVYESYAYDAKNQLVSVTRGDDTWFYAYDLNGNILSVKKNDETDPEKAYGYTDTKWKDKLTSFNGSTITYDAIGNPLQYRDNINLTWANGRKLASFTQNGATTNFTYDGDGNRIRKVSGNTTIDYIVIGGTIYGEIRTENGTTTSLHYLFDENGTRIGFVVNGTDTYYYRFNLQGDVTGIYNASGTLVVQYTYDAWGNPETPVGDTNIANLNPIRYRGYYYDIETGFYYVSSRYYDPETGRFINADSVIAGVGGSIQGYNMFTYCFNNPVNMSDSSGHWPQWIKDAANWVNNNIIQPVANFFSPSTNTIGGSFEEGPFIGSGSLTGGYSEIMLRGQGDKKVIPKSGEPSVTVGAFAKVSGGNAAGKIGVGNKDASLSLKGVGDVLTASAQAGLKYQGGLGLTAKAKAAVFSGRATVEFQLFGWQIELGVTGDAISAGAEATIGIFDGAFEAKANASLGVGGGFVFRVKPG